MEWASWVFGQIDFPEHARILEVGCGPGGLWKSTSKAEDLNWSAYLTDLSSGMVTEARAALGASSRFRFLAADAQCLPFPSAHFDGLLSCHMMYHVPNLPKAIAEFHRVLKPGGHLFVATNGGNHLKEFWQFLSLVSGDEVNMTASHSFGLENGADQLGSCFSDVKLWRFKDALVVPEVEPLMDYARSSERLSETQLNKLEQILQSKLGSGKPIHIQKESGLFSARKGLG